ncbi:threonine/serine exporter family protein [Frondihabitans cladoniiphilus]|uniref:Threonine/serine exporter family protein n=1 Tax=Frondihabitans cladoniiphilus TaxID=715785 RepID=A0ABP8VNV7_9MICO
MTDAPRPPRDPRGLPFFDPKARPGDPKPPRLGEPKAPRAPRPKARKVGQQDMRDIRARLRGTLYERVTPDAGISGDQYSARQIVDFSLDLGEVMLSSGADVRSVEVAIVAVATKWNLAPLELDISGSAITIQYAPAEATPLVKVRVIHAEGANLNRLANVYKIVDGLLFDDLDMTTAVESLVDVLRSPPRWPRWLMDGGLALLTVSVSFQAGGSWQAGVGAFVLMLALQVAGRLLVRRGIPQFFVSGSQGAAAAAIGTLAIWAGVLSAGGAAAMVAAAVVVLLPHPTLVTWAQDAISGFRAMALSRALIIGLAIGGVVVGVPAGLALTHGLHLEVDPTNIHLTALPLGISLLSTIAAAGANCFVQGASARIMPIAVGASLLAAVVLYGLRQYGLPLLGATFLAAAVLGAVTTVAAARMRTNAAVIAVPAFCGALLPGIPVSTALLGFLGGTPGADLDFVAAVLVALGIGAGLVLGNLVATPGARRYLRRSKRVQVHSLHTDTTPLHVMPNLGPGDPRG